MVPQQLVGAGGRLEPCSSATGNGQCQEELLASIYQAAMTHAGPYGHGRAVSHPSWEAFTFVGISGVVLVVYILVLSYLATRALRQMPSTSENLPESGQQALLDSCIVYSTKTGACVKSATPGSAEPQPGIYQV